MALFDKIKAKADELGLVEKAKEAANTAQEKAGELAHDNKEKIDSAIDKAGAVIDEKTKGKYSDKIDKATGVAHKGTDIVAEQRPNAAERVADDVKDKAEDVATEAKAKVEDLGDDLK